MLRILVLSEDGSRDTQKTLLALIKKMMLVLDPRCQTQRVVFEPDDDDIVDVVRANRWKSTRARDYRDIVKLRRALATRLMEQDGFVFFHVDGDTTWSQRAESENSRKFDHIIRDKVRALIAACHPDLLEQQCSRHLQRLFLLMPFYSIEAWVYQNTDEAIRICQRSYGGRDVECFRAWALSRESIDEVDRPKEAVCLGSKHNRELASTAFPARLAYDAGTSFAATVNSLLDSDDLLRAIEATWRR